MRFAPWSLAAALAAVALLPPVGPAAAAATIQRPRESTTPEPQTASASAQTTDSARRPRRCASTASAPMTGRAGAQSVSSYHQLLNRARWEPRAMARRLLAMIILSWIAPGSNHPAIYLLYQITEPVMAPFRKLLPPMGGLDLSPILVFILINVIQIALRHTAASVGLHPALVIGI